MTKFFSFTAIPLVCCLVFVFAPFTAQTQPKTTEQKYRCNTFKKQLWAMKSLMQRKKFLENIGQECPDDSMLQYYFAVNLERRLHYQRALHYYRLSIKLNNLFPQAYFGMGETYAALGDKASAVQWFQKGLEIQPDNTWGSRQLDEIIAMDIRPNKLNTDGGHLPKNPDRQHAPGEYAKRIAERYGINLNTLIQAQKKIEGIKKIAERYGIALDDLLGTDGKTAGQPQKSLFSKGNGRAPNGANDGRKKYLTEISKRYGIQLDELSRLNQQLSSLKEIADRYGINVNELIGSRDTVLSFEAQKKQNPPATTHKVTKNEYLSQIANRYGVSLDDIVKVNKEIGDPHWIFPGQVIVIPDKKKN